jgi:hypothetical protein
MVGKRCANQPSLRRLTLALWRSVATCDFFMREAKALSQVADCRAQNLLARGIGKCVM